MSTGASVIAERMVQDILEHERLLRAAAEEQIGEWQSLVRWLAAWLDPSGLDDMAKRQVELRTPQDYRAFFQAAKNRMDRSRLWGFDYAQGAELQAENRALAEQVAELRRTEVDLRQQLAEAQARAQGLEREVQTLQDRLTQMVAAAPAQPAAADAQLPAGGTPRPAPISPSPLAVRPSVPFDPKRRWPKPLRGDRDAHVLWMVGSLGWSLRQRLLVGQADYIVAQGGQAKPTSGSVKRTFQYLDGSLRKGGLSSSPVLQRLETSIGTVNLLLYSLSDRGRRLYRKLFDQDPVESELERLQRLHQADTQPKHAALVIGTAFYAEQYLTRCKTVICPPSPLEGTDPDIYIEWSGGALYVECERTAQRRSWGDSKVHKWQRQVVYQGAVALVAPDPDTQQALLAAARASIPAGTPVWATNAEHWRQSYTRIAEIRQKQGLSGRSIPDDGMNGATWFWAVVPRSAGGGLKAGGAA